MDNRSRILAQVKQHQPVAHPLPVFTAPPAGGDLVDRFKTVLVSIGGQVLEVERWEELTTALQEFYPGAARVVVPDDKLAFLRRGEGLGNDAHALASVEVAVLRGHFGVAENGAVWVTDALMGDRALPWIAEQLVLVIPREAIVPHLHAAYERLQAVPHALGTFIAGPSKTADIEQSLVLGAHGPKGALVVLVKNA